MFFGIACVDEALKDGDAFGNGVLEVENGRAIDHHNLLALLNFQLQCGFCAFIEEGRALDKGLK